MILPMMTRPLVPKRYLTALAKTAMLCLLAPDAFGADCMVVGPPDARLACFERDAFVTRVRTGHQSDCLSVVGDAARLRCFDGRRSPENEKTIAQSPRPSMPPADLALDSAQTGSNRPGGPAAVSAGETHVPQAAVPPEIRTEIPPSVRIAVGGGYGVGDHNGLFRVDKGSLDLQSLAGGSGTVLVADVWWDRALANDVGLGLEVLRMRNRGRASLDLPDGIMKSDVCRLTLSGWKNSRRGRDADARRGRPSTKAPPSPLPPSQSPSFGASFNETELMQ